MRAIVQDRYGSAEVLRLADTPKPEPGDNEVLLEVAAASLHAGDYFLTTGVPYLMRLGLGLRRPRKKTPGFDVAGTVAAVGANVTEFRTGDEVFGEADGSCAEYAISTPKRLAPVPERLNLEESAPLAVSGIAALRGIRDAGRVGPGDHVLINGAAGGVGTYAVQVAKTLGAEVTGVGSTRNVEFLAQLGADHVIDYNADDFTAGGPQFDVILDNVANHTLAEMRRALKPGGRLIPNSGRSSGRWMGPFGRMLAAATTSLFVRRQGRPFFAPINHEHLMQIRELVDNDQLRPIIEKRYSLAEAPQAMAEIGSGHSRGKVLITM